MTLALIKILLVFFLTLILSLVFTKFLVNMQYKIGVLDKPGKRKIHTKETPTMGGVSIFLAFIISYVLFVYKDQGEFVPLILSLTILFVVGIVDDIYKIKSSIKLVFQIFAAVLLVYFLPEIQIKSLYSLNSIVNFSFSEISSFLLSVFLIISLVNAYNLSDGIDGLASSIAIFILLLLSVYFYINNQVHLFFICLIMLSAVLGFLVLNWFPAKIFMGDTGSLIIGFFLSFVLLKFVNTNETAEYAIKPSFTVCAVLFAYPVFDLIRVFYLRLKFKRSPFSPDKLHTHLILKRLGFAEPKICFLIIVVNSIQLLLILYLNYIGVNEVFLLLFYLVSFCLFNLILKKKIKKHKLKKTKNNELKSS